MFVGFFSALKASVNLDSVIFFIPYNLIENKISCHLERGKDVKVVK